ncbi:MAG: glycine cleavage system protein GcvH [Desulfobacteraceae bacterium]
MKEIEDLKLPDDLRYSKDHEWAAEEGDLFKIGISDYAQDQLGDVVFVELPTVGALLEKGQEFGTVESVKAVSELYMPMSGEVMEINDELEDRPELVNEDPYEGGWMIKIKVTDSDQLGALMDRQAYLATLKG